MITSLQFFGILFISYVIYWLLPNKLYLRQSLLIISSFIFLYYFDISAVIIAISLSVYSYIFGEIILKHTKKSFYHILSVTGLLLCLVYFKYIGLLATTFNSLTEIMNIFPKFEIKHVLLPLGISYIVLKHISYLTDIKWGIIKRTNFIDFLLYSSLFTIFTAGPIERYEKFQPQIENKDLKFEWLFLDKGFQRIVFGLFKKFALADWIAYFINPVLEHKSEYSLGIKVLALIGFSFQIYFDFSGYSDIAIGSSKLFGFRIMENFDYPYLKRNISQFWRGWHISLSDWIRDYVFMPLAKISNKKVWLLFFVPMISMGLIGIWHGAKWGFLIWGLWHGLGISIYQILKYYEKRERRLKKINDKIFVRPISIAITFIFVTLGWLWFI